MKDLFLILVKNIKSILYLFITEVVLLYKTFKN